MARKQNYDYYSVFVTLAEYSCQAAGLAHEVLHNFNPKELPNKLEEIHCIEHAADEKKHEMMQALAKEFLPPIEVEDIAQLAHLIDNVTDYVEDILIKLYAYNIQSIRPEAFEFSEIITKCCAMLPKVMQEFKHFRKSTKLHKYTIEINDLEGEADDLYTKAMHDLHANSKDPIEVLTWSRMLDCLERCCDATENVADSIENIVMKNS